MKKNLAIIGASYLQLPLIEKAKEMGYTTHVFAWAANDVGEKAADYFYPISVIEKDQILEVCKKIGICGICSIASDVAVITVNYIAEKMNLPGNTIASTGKCTNKHLMRQAFEQNDDPSPKSFLVENGVDISSLSLTYPAIVKPTDRSGSRGIYKVYSAKEAEEVLAASENESFEKKALIEEFAEGQEYSVEYISYKGKHYFLALTKKYTTGAPHFIETGHLEPAPVSDEMLEKVKSVVSHALNSLEIKNGASHSEIKIDEKAMIISEDIYVSVTRDGYIKRISQRSMKASTNIPFGKKEDDILISLHHANTLNHVLLFTNKGNYLFVPVHKIEEFKWKDLGKHVSYLVKVGADEKIISSILVQDFNLPLYVLMATKNGQIKRTLIKDFEVSRYSKAITCMKVKEQDTMICALLTDNQQGIFIVSKAGYGGLYSEQEVSIVGLKAAGIKALNLKNDSIAAVDVFDPLENYSVLILSEDGQMKRLKLNDIPACKRTTKGITLYKNLKTKTIYVKNAFVLSSKESASVYTSKSKEYSFKPTDFNNASLESRFSSFIKLEKDETILWSQINRVITTNDYDVKQENQNLQSDVIELKESKEKTLLDDFDIQEVPIKKETSNSKKKNTIKYEKITLEDILNDDEF